MRNLVSIFEELFREHDGFQRDSTDFSRAMETVQWKFLVDAILMIRGEMARDMDVFERELMHNFVLIKRVSMDLAKRYLEAIKAIAS